MYSEEMVAPMRQELADADVAELKTSEEVQNLMKQSHRSSVVFINSVCGCSAGTARPAFISSLKDNTVLPLSSATVFAGVDQDATATLRSYIEGYPPSSPSIAFFRDGDLVHFVERKDIEGSDAETLKEVLHSIYDKFFGTEINESIKIKSPNSVSEMDVHQIKEKLDKKSIKLLDCRSYEERDIAFIENSILLDEENVKKIIEDWPKNEEIVIYCHHGNRSQQAVRYFKQFGFDNLYSMAGGIDFWSQEIDNKIKRY